MNAGRHVHVILKFVDVRNGIAQGAIRREIEGHGDGRKLPLMVNGERLGCVFKMCERAEWHGLVCS